MKALMGDFRGFRCEQLKRKYLSFRKAQIIQVTVLDHDTDSEKETSGVLDSEGGLDMNEVESYSPFTGGFVK